MQFVEPMNENNCCLKLCTSRLYLSSNCFVDWNVKNENARSIKCMVCKEERDKEIEIITYCPEEWRVTPEIPGMSPADLMHVISRTAFNNMFNLSLNEKELSFVKNGITDDHFEIFSNELARDAMAQCTSLNLQDNNIGVQDMQEFAKALASGAMANCEKLNLAENQIGDVGMRFLASAIVEGALANCQFLSLALNKIGRAGITEFVNACKQGMAECLSLMLGGNQIDDDGIIALPTPAPTGHWRS